MTTESGTTEQKLSPLERARLAKAEAEKRKSDEAARVEAEARSSQETVESAARERAEQKQQAEAKVGECRATIDAKQAEYDEISQMAAEGGDAEFVAQMEDLKKQASDALAEARVAFEEAEEALRGFSEPVAEEAETAATSVLGKMREIRSKSRGILEADEHVSAIDGLRGKKRTYVRSTEALLVEIGDNTDPESFDKLVAELKAEIEALPQMVAELKQSRETLDGSLKDQFGYTMVEAVYQGKNRIPVEKIAAIADFLEKDPRVAAYIAACDRLASMSQKKLKLAVMEIARAGKPPTSILPENIHAAAEDVLSRDDIDTIHFASREASDSSGIVETILDYKNNGLSSVE